MRLSDILKTWRTGAAGTILAELFGGLIRNKAGLEPLTTLTYGVAVTPDLAAGNQFIVTATDGVAFTINAPTFDGAAMSGTVPGFPMVWTLTIANASGGVLGVVTFNAAFKQAALVNPANGQSKSITYRWNGTNHVEIGRTPADVPN